ncbi:MAG: hypothetical protein AAF799_19590 [Myxococcota bacterium]
MVSAANLALAAALATPTGQPLPLRPRATVTPAPAPARLAQSWAMNTLAEPSLQSRGSGALSADEQARRDAVAQALLDAEAAATEHPETAEDALHDALDRFSEVAPLVGDDADAQKARTFALLALARTYLVLERPDDAAAVIDDALRAARGQAVPAKQFGPQLGALHDARMKALGGQAKATLVLDCTSPCRAWVDERPFDPESPELLPGAHRVWVESTTAGQPVVREDLDLAAGQEATVRYEVELPPEPGSATATRADEPRRLLPRWASVLALSLGTGLAGAGGALVAIDHRCPSTLADPRSTDCLNILNTDSGGFALIGFGSVTAITAAVILIVDEIRDRRAGPSGYAHLRSR